jgi:adenosylcobinamide hydrolase
MLKLVIAFLSLIFTCAPLPAADIPLDGKLDAAAMIVTTDHNGLWEKTLVIRFPQSRRVLGTNDGFLNARAVMNHAAHPLIWMKAAEAMKDQCQCGGKIYLAKTLEAKARELGIPVAQLAHMATAADMDNYAMVTKKYPPFIVTALVTAGAKTNAIRTGVDEGTNIESEDKPAGTVNIITLTNARLTDAAMARAIITVTEAKTAAFEELKIPSSYTKGVQATGTGTDGVIIVTGTNGPTVTYTGGHSRIGELMGKAVYEAVMEALDKQNGFRRPAFAERKEQEPDPRRLSAE